MKIKIISCQIFEVYVNHLCETISFTDDFDVVYVEIDQHNEPQKLRQLLQQEIDLTIGYDYILMLYGICGNSISGLQAKTIPIVFPRVHDCATILLGGLKEYKHVLGHRPSQGWTCISYDKTTMHDVTIESHPAYIEYKEKYGEDNAMYLFDLLYPKPSKPMYISMKLEQDNDRIEQLPSETEIVFGSLSYLRKLLQHDWSNALILLPSETVIPVYDLEEVIRKKQ